MMTTLKDSFWTIERVKKKLVAIADKNLGGENSRRKMIVTPVYNCYETIGHIYFSLNGSAPKAFSIYIPEYRTINFYDNRGKRVNEFSESRFEEFENKPEKLFKNIRELIE